MVANIIILGVTLQKTFYIFGLDGEARAATNVTEKVTCNGTSNHASLVGMTRLIFIWIGSLQFVYNIYLAKSSSTFKITLESCFC